MKYGIKKRDTEKYLYTHIDDEGETELIDTLDDERTQDGFMETEEREIRLFYIDEFNRLLDGIDLDIILYVFNHDNYNYADVAENLGVSQSTIRSRLRFNIYIYI